MKELTFKVEWADRSSVLIRIELQKKRSRARNVRRKRGSKQSHGSAPDIAESMGQHYEGNGKDQKALEELKRRYLRRPLE